MGDILTTTSSAGIDDAACQELYAEMGYVHMSGTLFLCFSVVLKSVIKYKPMIFMSVGHFHRKKK